MTSARAIANRKARNAAAAAARLKIPHRCEICQEVFFQNGRGQPTTFCGVECRTGKPMIE